MRKAFGRSASAKHHKTSGNTSAAHRLVAARSGREDEAGTIRILRRAPVLRRAFAAFHSARTTEGGNQNARLAHGCATSSTRRPPQVHIAPLRVDMGRLGRAAGPTRPSCFAPASAFARRGKRPKIIPRVPAVSEDSMKIKTLPLAKIKPYERNPRRNDQAVEAVAESIPQCGYCAPIVVDKEGGS